MSWFAVPNLIEGRDQLNSRFPNRDKSSEGMVGDLPHQMEPSSHNPDQTGKPEFNDHDGKDEVRAWDADKDLNDPNVTMERVVQHLVTGARSGKFWWIRYIIYDGRIWHRSDGFQTRVYTGTNKHKDHAHINSDFTQQADTVTGTNWEFNTLGRSMPNKPDNEGDDEEMSFGSQPILSDVTPVSVPGGAIATKTTWLVFCNDTFGADYALRLYCTMGDGNWSPVDNNDGLEVFKSGVAKGYKLPDGVRAVSIKRMAIDELGKVVPVTDSSQVSTPRKSFTGPLSYCLER